MDTKICLKETVRTQDQDDKRHVLAISLIKLLPLPSPYFGKSGVGNYDFVAIVQKANLHPRTME